MKTIKEFFPNQELGDEYDMAIQKFTADDIESYVIHVLLSLAEECQEMIVREEVKTGVSFIKSVYAVPKETIIDKTYNIW